MTQRSAEVHRWCQYLSPYVYSPHTYNIRTSSLSHIVSRTRIYLNPPGSNTQPHLHSHCVALSLWVDLPYARDDRGDPILRNFCLIIIPFSEVFGGSRSAVVPDDSPTKLQTKSSYLSAVTCMMLNFGSLSSSVGPPNLFWLWFMNDPMKALLLGFYLLVHHWRLKIHIPFYTCSHQASLIYLCPIVSWGCV